MLAEGRSSTDRAGDARGGRSERPAARVTAVGESLVLGPLRFLTSSWPWRSLAYLATGAVQGVVVGAVALLLLIAGVAGLVVLAGTVALLALVLLGVPVAKLERSRLRLVEAEPLEDPHTEVAAPGLRAWLRVRLREQATWRELGFTALIVFGLCWVDLGMLSVTVGLPPLIAATPFYTSDPDASRWFIAAAGPPLLVPAAYLLAAWATARATLVRVLLGPRDPELGARLAEVARSRARLVAAFDDERRLLERDLHDGAQRHLVAVSVSLGLARVDLPEDAPGVDLVDKAQAHAERALAELRAIIRGVHPPVLSGRGLAAAVGDIVDDVPVPVDLVADLGDRLPPSVEATAYFCVSEALTNVARHSGAIRARVRLTQRDGLLVAEVHDDGHGGADLGAGRGLAGLADRLAVVDGRLEVHSPSGGPTTVRIEIPVPAGES